jgi:hypothetical protein
MWLTIDQRTQGSIKACASAAATAAAAWDAGRRRRMDESLVGAQLSHDVVEACEYKYTDRGAL